MHARIACTPLWDGCVPPRSSHLHFGPAARVVCERVRQAALRACPSAAASAEVPPQSAGQAAERSLSW
ncbi:hypothetical protein EON67_12180 [archaeon]|nr:MAG: hypothetical protein EON67_12180 [archaeon]